MSKTSYEDYLGGSFDLNSGELNIDKAREQVQKSKDKFNILIAGATGVGKSSLINAFFGEEIAKTGVGQPVTQGLQKIEVKNKGLVLWDTKGIEAKDYEGTVRQLDSELETEFKMAENVGDVPHLTWLCIDSSGARIEPRDMELVSILRRHGLPLVVVFTKDMGPDSDAFIEAAQSGINAEHGASIRGRFARVNSVERRFTGFTLSVSGLEELHDISKKFLEEEGLENAVEAFKKVQRVKMKERLQAMVSGAEKKVHIASAAAGVAGASPIPGSDAPIIAGIQSTLIFTLNSEFEVEMGKSVATSIIAGILGVTAVAQVGKAVVANALKFIPVAGSFAGGAISAATAAAITEAIGHAYIRVLKHFFDEQKGRVVLPEDTAAILSLFKNMYKKP